MLKIHYSAHNYLGQCQIDLELLSGKLYLLQAPNGAGKTTLLKLMQGLQLEESFFNHQGSFDALEHYHIDDILDILKFQDFNKNLFESLLLIGDLQKQRHKSLATYSAGQKQWLKNILSLSMMKQNYFFDEPFNYLDYEKSRLLLRTIQDFLSQGKMFFIVDHNPFYDDSIYKKLKIITTNSGVLLSE
jgi:ABC-type multidrug transport system ATPase subunit